jgi:chemotaxis protein MotB
MKAGAPVVVVVRKRSKHKHSHHGGSWKIAYADFMTAMMAFFLVMWLVSSSNPSRKQQIADYFKMPLKVSMTNGKQESQSDSIIPGGGDDFFKEDGEVRKSSTQKKVAPKAESNLKSAKDKLENLIQIDPRLSDFKSNIRISLTDDGLLIQIVDSKERPMFLLGKKNLEPYMQGILQALVPVINELPNKISITGHTDALPYAGGEGGYSNWELSSDRANASRRTLVAAGLGQNKILRVVGTADTMVLTDTDSSDPANRRISILVLSQKKEKSIIEEESQSIKEETKIRQGTDVSSLNEKVQLMDFDTKSISFKM